MARRSRGYYFSFTMHRWNPTPLIALVIIVVLAAAGYAHFRAEDIALAEEQQAAIDKAVSAMQKEANSVKVTIDLSAKLNSNNYILLQLSDYNRKFESKDLWVDVTTETAVSTDTATSAGAVTSSAVSASATMGSPEYAESAINADAFMHERIRLEKGRGKQIYPASMTKILSTLVVVENISPDDFDKELELTQKDMTYLVNDGASTAGFVVGEKVKIKDLIYGMMLPSGAECTSALATYVAGSVEKFVSKMNVRAGEIGMINSRFSNPIGLHDEDTYTTVSDMALLLDYAIRNEKFLEIMSTQEHNSESTNFHKDGLKMKSTLFQQGEIDMEDDDGKIFGGKTGYTEEAGQCLASYMEKGGERFILVTAAAMPEDFHKEALHVRDMQTVYNSITVTKP